MEYKVTWTIELDADYAEDAAEKALEIQRDRLSHATVFKTKNLTNGEKKIVDLGW